MDTLAIIFLILIPVVSAIVALITFFCTKKHTEKVWGQKCDAAREEGYRAKEQEVNAKFGSAEARAKQIESNAAKEGENKKRDYLLSAKEEVHRCRIELEREIKERRTEIQKNEHRLVQKEEILDKKTEALEMRENAIKQRAEDVENAYLEAKAAADKQIAELERVSSLSREDAKNMLLATVESDLEHEKAVLIKDYESQLKIESGTKAKEVIATAIQKCAADYVSEMTVTVVPLPNDDMKGRIIGREGRNIKAIETLTGIDLIIDDTPEAIILSGYHPVRREVARIALEKLIADGRIHPTRIEEMVDKARKEVDAVIRKEGENATYETGVYGLHPEVIKLLGRLKYRTSYGQSVLIHSIEVSRLAGIMAEELGEDVTLAKRAGLLHDIGKSVDFEMEGSHIEIGADLAKKYKEPEVVVNAIQSHHGDVEPTSVISVLVAAADAISAARPGARRETLESYIKRLEKLEEIANSFSGVEKTFAIQAGREVRIMVKPDEISDDKMTLLARDICQKIESEMEYPGQIKVTMVRETRVVDSAK